MMVKEGKEGRNKYFYHFCRFLCEKEVGEHKDSVASHQKAVRRSSKLTYYLDFSMEKRIFAASLYRKE